MSRMSKEIRKKGKGEFSLMDKRCYKCDCKLGFYRKKKRIKNHYYCIKCYYELLEKMIKLNPLGVKIK